MTIQVGSKLGPYEILAPLGAGGMGEVWKARDTRLDRSVAIKISQEQFSDRFEREARAIAQLNHPHICTLHDIGPNYLVMEHVEGETLDARLRKGPLPLPQLLTYGAQIAGALAAAHASGIVHRDLKPGNIILTKSGAKLLDFGLARSITDQTITSANVILGTPAYMAPEQREGLETDARTDIYALGLVLREMATGTRGAPLTDLPYLAHIIGTCLQESPADRWQSAADVQRLLTWAPPEPPPIRSSRLPWIVAFAALAVLLLSNLAWYRAGRANALGPSEFQIALDKERGLLPVPSPDGTLLAFHGFDSSGRSIIWIRPVNSITARAVPGTEGAGPTLFWSPDGGWIGFYASGSIRKIRPSGGASLRIADTSDLQDADWNEQGDIIFRAGNREPLQHVRDSGGTPRRLTELNAGKLENSHRFPSFLPGGRRFLFTSRCADRENNSLYIGSLDSPEIQRVGPAQSRASYVDGRLIFYRDGSLVVQRFDAGKGQLSGEPTVILEKVGYNAASVHASFRVSRDGRLIIANSADLVTSRLVWFERSGQELSTAGVGQFLQLRLAPSGSRILFQSPDPKSGNRDLWLMELDRGITHRITSHPSNDWHAVWSPDGKQAAFGSDRGDGRTFLGHLKASLDLAAKEDQLPGMRSPMDWSHENWIAHGNGTIFVSPLRGGESIRFSGGDATEWNARFSPDSRWIAFSSNEIGRSEIYARRFSGRPDPAAPKVQISNNGGEYPAWNGDGSELYYLSGDGFLYAVATRSLDRGSVPPPNRLFKACPSSEPASRALSGSPYFSPFDTRDGKRFLIACLIDNPHQYSVLMNWSEAAR